MAVMRTSDRYTQRRAVHPASHEYTPRQRVVATGQHVFQYRRLREVIWADRRRMFERRNLCRLVDVPAAVCFIAHIVEHQRRGSQTAEQTGNDHNHPRPATFEAHHDSHRTLCCSWGECAGNEQDASPPAPVRLPALPAIRRRVCACAWPQVWSGVSCSVVGSVHSLSMTGNPSVMQPVRQMWTEDEADTGTCLARWPFPIAPECFAETSVG